MSQDCHLAKYAIDRDSWMTALLLVTCRMIFIELLIDWSYRSNLNGFLLFLTETLKAILDNIYTHREHLV
jgi:hypothetical protein